MNNAIYMALDSNYEKYATNCLNSLRINWVNHPKVFIFYDTLTSQFLDFLKTFNDRVKLVKIDNDHEFLNLGPVNNKIVYNKYNCWNKKYFDDFDNVMHLDCDTVILKPCDNIFNGDSRFFTNNESEDMARAFKNISIPMCNAGVFVVNKRHITDDNYKQLYEMTDTFSNESIFADQSIISMWCKSNDVKIEDDVYFNFQPQFLNFKDDGINKYNYDKISILHFAARKPDTISFHTWWRCDGWTDTIYKTWEKYK